MRGGLRERRDRCCLLAQLLDEHIRAEGLGAFDGQAEGAGPHQLGEDAQGAGHSKHHRVVVHLLQTVILLKIFLTCQ